MSKKGNGTICTSECINCVHSNISKENVSLKFHCNAKNKDYIYGQYVPCEFMELKKHV